MVHIQIRQHKFCSYCIISACDFLSFLFQFNLKFKSLKKAKKIFLKNLKFWRLNKIIIIKIFISILFIFLFIFYLFFSQRIPTTYTIHTQQSNYIVCSVSFYYCIKYFLIFLANLFSSYISVNYLEVTTYYYFKK